MPKLNDNEFKLGKAKIKSIFCCLSSGEELCRGRVDREKIRNGIYECAGQCQGMILTSGEAVGLTNQIGLARNSFSKENLKVPKISKGPNIFLNFIPKFSIKIFNFVIMKI